MRKRINLPHRRSMIAAYSLAPRKSNQWVVFLPESGSDFQSGTRRELQRFIGKRLAAKFNYLVFNKPGLKPGGVNGALFERSFRQTRRVADALKLIRAIVPSQDKIYLIGYSEGAYLAPAVARREPRVCSVVIIGGGTRGWLKEEIANARTRELKEVRQRIRQIESNPRSLEKWNGFSHATWHSYRQDDTLKALRGLNRPVLAVLGGRDRIIDLKSTLQDLRGLSARQEIRIQLLRDCGHSFNGHWIKVRQMVNESFSRWLNEGN